MLPGDLDRFHFYARRVRTLEYKQYDHGSEPLEAHYEDLWTANGGPLLPRLTCIRYATYPSFHRVVEDAYRLFRSFVTPRLTSLSIDECSDRESDIEKLYQVLDTLPKIAPRLETLRLAARLGSLDLPRLKQLLERYPALCRVALDVHIGYWYSYGGRDKDAHITPEILLELAALPKLCELRMWPRPSLASGHNGDPVVFPALEALTLTDFTTPFLIIRLFALPALRRLVLTDDQLSRNWDFDRLMAAACSGLSQTLEEINIAFQIWRPVQRYRRIDGCMVTKYPGGETYSVDLACEVLSPLLCYHNLQVVTFAITLPLSISDTMLLVCAQAWPRLRKLQIKGDYKLEKQKPPAERPTYLGLVHLVRACRDLAEISIVLGEPKAQDRSLDVPVSRNRVRLHFYHSTLDSEDFTARWVAKMFPYVAVIQRTILKDFGQTVWPEDSLQPVEVEWPELYERVQRHRRKRQAVALKTRKSKKCSS